MQGKKSSVCSFEAFLTICTRGKICTNRGENMQQQGGKYATGVKLGSFYGTNAPHKVKGHTRILNLPSRMAIYLVMRLSADMYVPKKILHLSRQTAL